MVIRYVRIGAVEDGWGYDDVDFPDGAIETDQPIKAGTPIDADDVLRLEDLAALVFTQIDSMIMFENEVVGFENNVVYI